MVPDFKEVFHAIGVLIPEIKLPRGVPNYSEWKPVDPEVVQNWCDAMDEAIPKIVEAVRARQRAANEARRRIFTELKFQLGDADVR